MDFTEDSLATRIETDGYLKVETVAVGEPDIVEIVSGGVFDGKRIPMLCSSPEIALEFLWYAYCKYRRSLFGEKSGTTLVWRIKPEVNECKITGAGDFTDYYSAYMRIAIR